jgi:hypothetical protein
VNQPLKGGLNVGQYKEVMMSDDDEGGFYDGA